MSGKATPTSHTHFFTAVIEGEEIVYRDYIDISVAVATPKVQRNEVFLAVWTQD